MNKILVVDDQPDLQEVTHLLLTHMGFEVNCAKNAEEAKELVHQLLPDIILIDLTPPDQDGLSFCADLKEQPGLSYIPRIILSGVDQQDIKPKSLLRFADDFITKPFNIHNLTERIQALIMSRADKITIF